MPEPMADDLAAVIVLVQDLVNTARTELAAGATAEDIVGTIVNAVDDGQVDEMLVVGAVAVYLLAREDWAVKGPAEPEVFDWRARIAYEDAGRVRTGELSWNGITTAEAHERIERWRGFDRTFDALYRRTPAGQWQEQEVPRAVP